MMPKIFLEVIFENAQILAINKPAGLPCVPIKSNNAPTVADLIIERYPNQARVGPPGEAGLLHRLDNATTGLLIIAKTEPVYLELRKIWNTKEVEKIYQAIVVGKTASFGVIENPIAHHPKSKKKMMICETAEKVKKYQARPAVTFYKRLRTFKHQETLYSELEVEIQTGVRHQIRVHLASQGNPLSGDKLYQSPRCKFQDTLNPDRPLLHLSQISLAIPSQPEPLVIRAKNPISNSQNKPWT